MQMTYPQALSFLGTLSAEAKTTKGTRKLERMRLLLELLDNPHEEYSCIHVAGTSGKGSTAHVAAQILQAHGFSVGLHTSPHLQVPNERMQVDGKFASEKEFAALASKIKPLCKQVEDELGLGKPTFYEATLAMALAHFAQKRVGFAVIEAGLGGSMDATNLIHPAVAVITNVSLDHAEILGKTLRQIASDKAGIVKPGIAVCTGARGTALEVISKKCVQENAELLELGGEIRAAKVKCSPSKTIFDLRVGERRFNGLELSLLGKHQAENAALAAAACGKCITLEEKPLRAALAQARAPCRLEVVQRNPTIILDGAHNPAKARALAEALRRVFLKKPVFVIGVAATKDAQGILSALSPVAREFVFTQGIGREFHSPAELSRMVGKTACEVEPGLEKAVGRAIEISGKEGLVCITGSLYVAGEARQRWLSNEEALKNRSLAISP